MEEGDQKRLLVHQLSVSGPWTAGRRAEGPERDFQIETEHEHRREVRETGT